MLYALKGLEQQTGLVLLDRSAYRTRLTPAGQRVLEQCQRLLAAEAELHAVCAEVRSGWEPSLTVVLDGIYPAEPVLRVVGELAAEHAPTRLHLVVDFLSGVEQTFERERADLMVAILPPLAPGLRGLRLPPVRARLVARRTHPLAQAGRKVTPEQLADHVLVTVGASDPRLQLLPRPQEQRSTVRLPDFHAKKAAILQGIGFGWLPDHLIARELRRGELVALEVQGRRDHLFEAQLHHREGQRLGRAASRLVEALGRRP